MYMGLAETGGQRMILKLSSYYAVISYFVSASSINLNKKMFKLLIIHSRFN